MYVMYVCVCVRSSQSINKFFHAVSSLFKTQWQRTSGTVAATQAYHPWLQDTGRRQRGNEYGVTKKYHQQSSPPVLYSIRQIQFSTCC